MDTLKMYPLTIAETERKNHNIVDQLIGFSLVKKSTAITSKNTLCEKIMTGGYPEVQSKSVRARTSWFRSYIEARILKDFEQIYSGRGEYIAHARALLNLLSGRYIHHITRAAHTARFGNFIMNRQNPCRRVR